MTPIVPKDVEREQRVESISVAFHRDLMGSIDSLAKLEVFKPSMNCTVLEDTIEIEILKSVLAAHYGEDSDAKACLQAMLKVKDTWQSSSAIAPTMYPSEESDNDDDDDDDDDDDEYTDYEALIEQIKACAAHSAAPENEEWKHLNSSTTSLSSSSTPVPTSFHARSTFGPLNLERESKIAAAGELFIYRHLRRLELPSFKDKVWKSRNRHQLGDDSGSSRFDKTWNTNTRANIVYEDISKDLGKWLRKNSCNGFPEYIGLSGNSRLCKYHIDIKTTISESCEEPFHLSVAEYKRMKKIQTENRITPDDIYVVILVFKLMSTDIDFKVFVDPWRSRQDNGINLGQPSFAFEVDSYKVTPSNIT